MLTSIKISLCNMTPRRILAKVIPIMMIKAPIIQPCDQASRVSLAGLEGHAAGTDIATQQAKTWMNKRVVLCARSNRTIRDERVSGWRRDRAY